MSDIMKNRSQKYKGGNDLHNEKSVSKKMMIIIYIFRIWWLNICV